MLLEKLYTLYRQQDRGRALLLDPAERQFLAEHQTLRVACVARERPYAYTGADGRLHGALKRIVSRLEQDLGVSISVETLTDPEEAYARVVQGEADICLNMTWEPGWAARKGID